VNEIHEEYEWRWAMTSLADPILREARRRYNEEKERGRFDGSEWFEFIAGSIRTDVEIWAWDDGDIRVTAYMEYDDDGGFTQTDHGRFVSLGVIDHDEAFVYPSPIRKDTK
jgi:hypothetical protein